MSCGIIERMEVMKRFSALLLAFILTLTTINNSFVYADTVQITNGYSVNLIYNNIDIQKGSYQTIDNYTNKYNVKYHVSVS